MNIEDTLKRMAAADIKQVRLAWCDLHGELRSKTLMPLAVENALRNGIGMLGTLALKDTSDRTALNVFEHARSQALPQFANAANMLLRPMLGSYQELPWAEHTVWMQGQLFHADGRPVEIDTRHLLQTAIAQLESQGLSLRCGLAVEFHIYKIENTRPQLDPELASWPGLPPAVSMLHPGYRLLSEQFIDLCEQPLRIVRETAQALGMPLSSLEIQMGPSQVEAVFEATDAMAAADHMVLFRSATRQALRRAGYHASFMCSPPFPGVVASGWHVNQSLVQLSDASNAFALPSSAITQEDWYKRAMAPVQAILPVAKPLEANSYLSAIGWQYLAGLLAHARGATALSNPSINAYARFATKALAPKSIGWGHDNRGAMVRVIAPRDNPQATRLENRVAEPMANPYLHIASQIYAGLDGITRGLTAPLASQSPNSSADKLPTSLSEALDALQSDSVLRQALGDTFTDTFCQIKRQEIARYDAAQDKTDWQRREVFGRF